MATKLKDWLRTPTEKAPEPALGTDMLPMERYLSEDFMRLEWERMWTKVWLRGCREEELSFTTCPLSGMAPLTRSSDSVYLGQRRWHAERKACMPK